MKIKLTINKKISKENKLNDKSKELKRLFVHKNRINKVLKENNNVCDIYTDIGHYHNFSKEKDCPNFIIRISFEFKDNCTIKYCKEYTHYIYKYGKNFGLKFETDYDSTIVRPIVSLHF